MPIIVVEQPKPPPPPVWLPRRIWFASPRGDEIHLDDGTYLLLHGAEVGPVEPDIRTARYPQHDGGEVRSVLLPLGEWYVPMAVQASGTAELRQALRRLEYVLDARQGPVTLTVTQADGEERSVTGYCKTTRGDYDIDYQLVSATITCPDPYWAGGSRTLQFVSSSAGGGGKALLASGTFFPLRLTPSQVIGGVTIDNDGDADAYGTWTFEGPFNGVRVESATLGLAFEVTGSVSAGQSVVVDTRPTRQTVRDGTGTNIYSRLTAASAMFPLVPGVNDLNLVMAGSTASTTATVAWAPRWRSA